jgi:putative DNA primase/helicase
MSLLKGSGEEMRGELLNLGARISPKHRTKLTEYLMQQYPKREVLAATRTGWHGTLQGWQQEIGKRCQGNAMLSLVRGYQVITNGLQSI